MEASDIKEKNVFVNYILFWKRYQYSALLYYKVCGKIHAKLELTYKADKQSWLKTDVVNFITSLSQKHLRIHSLL